VIAAAGYGEQFIHRTGHSLGPGPRVHGLGANLDDYETRDERMLLRGTGFTVEPGVYLPDFGVRLEVDVFRHPDGAIEVTTPLQADLTLLD
jgi:Xaa-Pro aminopeptidase